MKKWMTDCVFESPAVCVKMLKEKDVVITGFMDLFIKKKYKKIVLVGSGSSGNIAMSAKYAIEKYLNLPVEVVSPSSFVEYDYKFKEEAFIVCMSQSGRSTNTIDAINKAKQCGYDVAAISMKPNSPLKNHCENFFDYGSYMGEDDSFVCRYFTSSVLFFILFAIETANKMGICTKEEYKKRLKEVNDVVQDMTKVIEKTKQFYEKNKKDLYSMKRCMAMGIGPTFGLTNEACLKISETTGISTNGYEVEEFLHGPAFEVKKDHALFFMDGDEAIHDRTINIYEAAHELTDRVYLITYSNLYGDNVINIDTACDPVLRPLLYVIPFQLIPGKICEDIGVRAVTIYNYRASQKAVSKRDD